MATWAVEEQTIPTTAIEGAITSLGLRVDHPDSSRMLMEVHTASDTYLLRFQRNGAFEAWTKVAPPAPPEAPPATEATHPEEEHHSKGKTKR